MLGGELFLISKYYSKGDEGELQDGWDTIDKDDSEWQ